MSEWLSERGTDLIFDNLVGAPKEEIVISDESWEAIVREAIIRDFFLGEVTHRVNMEKFIYLCIKSVSA